MKKNLFYIMFSLFVFQQTFSQASLNAIKTEAVPYEVVEYKPQFPGGANEFVKYIAKNFKAPPEEGLYGDVIVNFVIEVDGSIKEAVVVKDIGKGTGEEAKRVVLKSPKWTPGEVEGVPVRVLFKLPIKLRN